ncbi:MAG: hypothetical protein ACTHLE_20545 [Agriterribacter sp.]
MKKTLFITLVCAGACFTLYAQESAKQDKSVNVSGAVGASEFSTSFAYQHVWRLGKKRKLGVGAGLRFTNYQGYNKYFKTAPAKLTSGKTGPGVLFSEDIVENIDSVQFKRSQLNALNLSINFVYDFNKKFSAGLNIDAIGFTVGGKRTGRYFGNNGAGQTVTASPTAFNLLLISDNDLGSLNSELFVKYKWNDKWGARVGFQFLFIEYSTDTKVQTTPGGEQNDRFRNKSAAGLFGITYQL